jgi:hypothetical protein
LAVSCLSSYTLEKRPAEAAQNFVRCAEHLCGNWGRDPLTGLMAVTLWLTAPTRGARNAAGAKVAELCDAPSNPFTSLF